jgi:hypothetical protein
LLAGNVGAAEPPPEQVVPDAPVGPGSAWPAATTAPTWSASAEYLFWWLREGRVPVTLTTSSQASQGLLDRPDTRVLYGGDRLETRHGDQFNGVRATLAYGLDDAGTVAIEGRAFFLERDSTHFIAVSDGSTLLARPYTTADGTPASEIIAGASPTGPRAGAFVGYSRVELFGEEANLVTTLVGDNGCQLQAVGGARFLQMRDRNDLTSSGHTLSGAQVVYGLEEHYRSDNTYYGAQVGLRGEVTHEGWFARLYGDVGLGGNFEHVRIFGDRVYQTASERVATDTGLLVQATNRGTHDRTSLNVVSEAGVQVGYRLTEHVRLFAGYTFLLWDGPARSGDQIDTTVNTHPGTGPTRPSVPFREDVFWAQGLDGGVEISW